MIKNCFILCLIALAFSCANSDDSTQATVNLKVNNCFDKFENETKICLDSVFNDSRCPTGLVYVWKGDVTAAFTLTKNKKIRRFSLHINDKFQNDTLIDGITIKLLDISPYPTANQQIDSADYRAEIMVKEN